MKAPITNPWLDTTTAALIHLIPLALVLAGRFDAIDLLIVYTVEIAVGLAFAIPRLVRRISGIDWAERGVPRGGRIVVATMAVSVPLVGLGLYAYGWGETAVELVTATDWSVARILLAIFTGASLAAYTGYRLRRGDTTAVGLGRVMLQMLVLGFGVTYGLRASEHAATLAEAGWELLDVTGSRGYTWTAWFVQATESLGLGPEVFAAIFIAGMMALNEAVLTVVSHLRSPRSEGPPSSSLPVER